MKEQMTVMEVYRKILQRADQLREAKNLTDEAKDLNDNVAQELYWVASQLELTPEVNPPKQCKCPKGHHQLFWNCF